MPDRDLDQLPQWAVNLLREPSSGRSGAHESIMKRVRHLPPPRSLSVPPSGRRWLRRGLLTPVGSAAVSAMVALAVVLRVGAPSTAPEAASSVQVVGDTVIPRAHIGGDSLFDTLRIVEFVLRAPGARSAAVVGSFNGWRAAATPMQPVRESVWRARVAVPRDVLRFSYIVNGEHLVSAPTLPLGS